MSTIARRCGKKEIKDQSFGWYKHIHTCAKQSLGWKATAHGVLEEKRSGPEVICWDEGHFSQPSHVYHILKEGYILGGLGLPSLGCHQPVSWMYDSWCSSATSSLCRKEKWRQVPVGYNPMMVGLSLWDWRGEGSIVYTPIGADTLLRSQDTGIHKHRTAETYWVFKSQDCMDSQGEKPSSK